MRTIIIYSLVLMFAGSLPGLAAAAESHDYSVTVDPALSKLTVEARFVTPVYRVAARDRNADVFVIDMRECGADEPLRVRSNSVALQMAVTCLRYTVDLQRAAHAERRNAPLSSSNIVVAHAAWLWRPSSRNSPGLSIFFDTPDDILVSQPWKRLDDAGLHYEVSRSPQNSQALGAFGNFGYSEADIPGSRLRIVLMRTDDQFDEQPLMDWVKAAASNVSLAYGRFPNPSPHVLMMPVSNSRSNSPVPFGRVVRDGGESVELFINENRPASEFYDDWTATHEFSHLMLPYVRSSSRWISEGFAQYYQNVLMARAGTYSAQKAWQKLYEGYERGRQSRPEMTPNQAADAGVRAATMKIYWSGAALALMADVELRRRSNGSETLDSVLERLQRCCLPSPQSWSGTQLFEKLDSLIDEPVFMPLHEQYANKAGFPDVDPLLKELGVKIRNGEVSLHDDARLAAIRAAITTGTGSTYALQGAMKNGL